ncbi:MAG: hypothetical protein JSR85_01270 [Proteobacteria bacterium]|nr:hypothetical protein [Pseudomonadota bacterium]
MRQGFVQCILIALVLLFSNVAKACDEKSSTPYACCMIEGQSLSKDTKTLKVPTKVCSSGKSYCSKEECSPAHELNKLQPGDIDRCEPNKFNQCTCCHHHPTS